MCTTARTFKTARAQRPAAPKPAKALPKPDPKLQQQPVKHHQRGQRDTDGTNDEDDHDNDHDYDGNYNCTTTHSDNGQLS